MKETLNSVILTTLAAGVLFFTFYVVDLKRENTRLREGKDYFNKTYLRKYGATALWDASREMVNYDLRSFDGGKMWYAVRCEGEFKDYINVLGHADEVYPGLLQHLAAVEELENDVKNNGSLNLTDPRSISNLAKIGFMVKTN